MYLTIIFAPLIGAISAGFFGRHLGHPGSMFITTFLTFFSFVLSCFAFNEVGIHGINQYVYMAKWIESGLFEANWSFLFDSLTVVMLVVVTGISTLVHLYSTEYMKEDPSVQRFMSYLSLFTFFMLMLVTGDNLMILFVGWEGVGLCSFLLINFWYTRIQANKAAMKAMIINRIADIGLALGVFTIFAFLKAIDYDVIFSIVPYFRGYGFFCIYKDVSIIDAICFFLFIGAMGKSAQIGLHTWLPDAMEGPTPVSALIHAATMVTAGVFLLVRCSPIFEYSPRILDLVTVIGASTAFFAATVGLLQNDLKRIIAYSTCSQLGYMIFACGVSSYGAAVFHLSNHAFFKALLFLSAGSVIHAMSDEQDIRRMGGLRSLLPYTYSMFLIGNLALMGFPFLSGFYSKDLILESAYAKYTYSGHYAYWLGTCAAFLTAFYSTRLMHMTFLAEPNGYKKVVEHVHESPIRMSLPLGILAIFSIFVGYLTKDMFVGLGTDFWGNAIFVHPYRSVAVDAEFVPAFVKEYVLIFSISGSLLSFYLYEIFFEQLFFWKLSPFGFRLYLFFNRKWMFDKVVNDFVTQQFLRASYEGTYKALDKGIFEAFGPTGLIRLINAYSAQHISIYTGLIFHSSFMMLLGVTMFIGYYLVGYYLGFAIESVVIIIILLTSTVLFIEDVYVYEEDWEVDIDFYEPLYRRD